VEKSLFLEQGHFATRPKWPDRPPPLPGGGHAFALQAIAESLKPLTNRKKPFSERKNKYFYTF
jgi:hypothetical protein